MNAEKLPRQNHVLLLEETLKFSGGDLTMKPKPLENPVVDPVCGMSVDPETAKIKVLIEGQHYFFCAEGCRTAFEKNPSKYMGSKCAKPKGWWGRYMAKLQKATGGKPMKCH